jgi:hypothetical protein
VRDEKSYLIMKKKLFELNNNNTTSKKLPKHKESFDRGVCPYFQFLAQKVVQNVSHHIYNIMEEEAPIQIALMCAALGIILLIVVTVILEMMDAQFTFKSTPSEMRSNSVQCLCCQVSCLYTMYGDSTCCSGLAHQLFKVFSTSLTISQL